VEREVTGAGSTRSAWDWALIVASMHAGFTRELQERLGVRPGALQLGPGAPVHKYRYLTAVLGVGGDVGLGLGLFLGLMVIEKLAPDTWGAQYFTVLGAGSFGVSAGFSVGQVSAWSEFPSPIDWTSGNFEGPYLTGGVAQNVALGGGPQIQYGGVLILFGDHSLPPLVVPADGWALTLGASVSLGEMGYQMGRLWGGKEQAIRAASERQKPLDTSARYATGSAVHFDVDDPSLTAAGRQAVREMVATHRAALTGAGSTLKVDGYASTTGTEAHNERLSQLRAANVLQAVRDVIGVPDALPPGQATAEGHGEAAARAMGVPDRTEDPAWRRVDVSLDGRVVLQLR
jgi:outer membrane protein OmpA-like peptidoglycan-associated protein